ncbi:uncharacterized protein JN550_005940 [Neoarthrinium moseri]|uniref:uncharacterized protein n=1 Tax=Neoarthrinium moseri TaxID=1658444 RepID=UPI001FDDA796|nr:uncharacterized protein JN550_005940 [Neoarthrinium moseri]KAI1869310.1 hypothetical protein JN550_005940 [Neoarthrinium moseri]
MGKITKTLQTKHKESLTPWLQEFVQTASSTPLPLLPKFLATFPTRWPFPRGDLYHWISLLNRFDSVLENFCSTYKLSDGPQMRQFGCDVLLSTDSTSAGGNQQWDKARLSELGYGEDGDVALVVAILNFTKMLLNHCGNRSIYASSSHLNDLLNSTDFAVICATLRVGVELAKRYQASVKRMSGTSRPISAALLSNHYNIDLDRVQQLAQPFAKTPIVRPSEPLPLSTPTASASKGKSHANKNAASMYANDLCAIAKPSSPDESDARWSGWGDVRLSYYPTSGAPEPSEKQPPPERPAQSSTPSTPTPLRRSNTANIPQSTPRSSRQAASEDSPSPSFRSPAFGNGDTVTAGQRSVEVPQSTILGTPVNKLLERAPSDLPKAATYDFLNRLRIAKALTGSAESRQDALKARLLAIENLAYIHTESAFIERVLKQDNDEPRRFQLIYQLAELIHPSADGSSDAPMDLQSIALSLLEAMTSFHTRLPDIFSALNATVNHGVLLYVIRKAVAEMKQDDSGEQYTEADEWRDNLFSLTLHITMAMTNNSARTTPEIISAGLLDIMVEILTIRSNVAERTHATLLSFLDNLIYSVHSSSMTIVSAEGLDAITDLITHEVDLARKLVADQQGTPPSYRSLVVDYEIPFYQQQNLKWLLKFIHHLMTNAFAYGGNTDRLLRNLVDKSALLRSLREITVNGNLFGSLVWTSTVSILSDFLNNDPTSFAAISEAGLVQSFLESITGRQIKTEQHPTSASNSGGNENGDSSPISPIEADDRPHPPTQEMLETPRPGQLACGIRPSPEAINVVPTVLNAISLNNQGMTMVASSRAFESFFEIFESPDHVRVMASIDTELAVNLGTHFDELARHHPALRPAITNAVLDMVARLVHLGKVKAAEANWGTKLVVKTSSGSEIPADSNLLGDGGDTAGKGKEKSLNASEEMDVDAVDADAHTIQEDSLDPESASPHKSILPYIFAASSFLFHYLGNAQLKQPLVHKGLTELLLDLCTSPSLPHRFGESVSASVLHNVIAQLVEYSPVIGMPSLLRRTQESIDALESLTKTSDLEAYFAPFLGSDSVVISQTPSDKLRTLADGTPIVKALLNVQSLGKALIPCFPYSSRAQTLTFPPVNIYDYFNQLTASLGPLLRSAICQEQMSLHSVPQNWYHSKRQSGPAEQPGQAANGPTVEPPNLGNDDETILAAILSPSGLSLPVRSGSASSSERKTSRYRNFETISTVLRGVLPVIFPLLSTIGRALLSRRSERGNSPERDAYVKAHHVKLAHTLADTLFNQLDVPVEPRSVKQFYHCITMTHALYEILCDRKFDGGRSERQGSHVIASVLVAFKQKGGFDKLNSMLRIFSDECCKEPKDGDGESLSKLAFIGMKKILDLYALLANAKVISDSVAQTSFLSRNTSRAGETHIAANLIVELRMSMLPVVRELWESPLAEKVSAEAMTKIIDILKLISAADQESGAYKRSDKNPPPGLLKQEPVKFSWLIVSSTVAQLKENGFDEALAREAVYRANGSPAPAGDYCRAHRTGIAGSSNPIPEFDAPSDDLEEPPSASTDSGNALPDLAPSGDQPMMDVDLPADIPAGLLEEEILGEFREAAGFVSGAELSAAGLPAAPHDANGATASSTSLPQATSSTGDSTSQNQLAVTKEDLDVAREQLRTNIIDRCIDVIRAHPSTCYAISELIDAAVIRSSTDDSAKQEIGETLVNALISLSFNDDLRPNGQSIAAYAHLLSLLLQNRGFYSATLSSLKENVAGFLHFLKPSSPPADELPSWIPYILLIFEILLSDDEQPTDVKWKAPSSEDDPIEPLQWAPKDLSVKADDRQVLMESILEILPKVGKAESLAVSVLRIIVILTRDRPTARVIGDKKNLQRLFVMTKQLSGSGSARLSETRISSYVLTILRHIIEDEGIIKQLMRSEIRFLFDNTRNQRPIDLAGYTRQLSHLALRDSRLFVDVSNEMIRLSRWTAGENGSSHRQTVVIKEQRIEAPKDDVAPTVRATEDLSIQDIKPSTEGEDKHSTDASKLLLQDTKRPILENPDGVIHFLLCELLNYREVDDKEQTQGQKDVKDTSESGSANSGGQGDTAENRPSDKDKKVKPVFKSEEHPIFIYRCFILRCLVELLQSYNQTKVEFINFKRSAPLQTNTPIKPRASVLNYLLTDLLCGRPLDGPSDSLVDKKRAATASQAQAVLIALMGKTNERPTDRTREKYDYDEEPDLLFVRRFVLDTILKAYKDASTSHEAFDVRYGRMLALSEAMHQIMGADMNKDMPSTRPQDSSPERSYAQIRRLMYEKGYLGALTSSIADIDLAFPPVKKTIKQILKVLRVLTSTAIHLSNANILPAASTLEQVEDDIASATSLSDMEDDREETPDLYRNSALGMLEPGRDPEDDYSDGSEDDDAEMYDEEYGDEMEYEEEVSHDGEEDVSDEDDEEVEGMGHIEGLPGDLGVVEIIDDEGNPVEDDGASGWESETDEDEGEEDDEDDEEIDYEAEAQDLEEAHMHGLDDVPDIGRFGNLMRAIEEDEDYEGGDDINNVNPFPEDDDEDGMSLLCCLLMVCFLGELLADAMSFSFPARNPGSLVEDDAPPPHASLPSMGWDTLVFDHGGNVLGGHQHHHRHRHGFRGPFPPVPFMMGGPRDPLSHLGGMYLPPATVRRTPDDPRVLGDLLADAVADGTSNSNMEPVFEAPRRSIPQPPTRVSRFSRNRQRSNYFLSPSRQFTSQTHEPVPTNLRTLEMRNFMRPSQRDRPSNNDDGLNPLLRRTNDTGRDSSPRPHHNLARLLGGHGGSPLSLLNDLITSLPTTMGRHALQFHISAPGPTGEMQEISLPVPHSREHAPESRRENQDPSQASAFSTESTMIRWLEETKMVFGPTHGEKSLRLVPAIIAHLVPPAIQREKEQKAREAEFKRRQEEERRKREEEERKAREAKEAEEKAAREKAEAEERERAEAVAAEAAAQAAAESPQTTEESSHIDFEDSDAMEGIETHDEEDDTEEPASNQPRVMTIIRGEEVDVTDLGIDAEYLEALPEEFREEVIAQAVTQRRSQAREAPRRTGEQTEVFQEFLDALPDDIRQEIVQQERAEQRRRDREEQRRQAATAGQEAEAQEMDTASILMTFPPALREQVLMDQGADLMDSLPPEMAAEARRLVRNHPAVVHRVRDDLGAGRVPDPAQPGGSGNVADKPQRRTIVQMLDKSGVATLLRLMFINVKSGSMENPLKHVIKDVCENKQTRLEVISTLLQILQDGTTDVEAVERSFASLSIKAKQQREKDGKTPQSMKRSLTNIGHSSHVHTSAETSPVLIVQQCLDLLCFLADEDVHVPGLFLTEHDIVGSTLKRSLSRKGKGKGPDLKTHKYAINSLLALLDRDLVIESSTIMDSLSQLLSRVTLPLLALDRKLKEADETIKKLDKEIEELETAVANSAASEGPSNEQGAATEAIAAAETQQDPSITSDAANTTEGSSKANPAEALAKAKDRREFIQKRVKTYVPPQIPTHNLTKIINIFVARECSSKTFKETLSAIKNLSVIPNAMDTFGEELARQSRLLSEKIVHHLDELLPHIEKASTGTEIQGVALAKFSPGAADQNKLLRVLTALDHLFTQKKPLSTQESESSNEAKKADLLATLYRNTTFHAMWDRLSSCLSAIRQRESLINVATILLPLIEALMVVCKDSANPDLSSSQLKETVLSSPAPESPMTNRFLSFTEEHRRILNELVRNNPSLMKGTFQNLVKNPKVLEFDNKRNWFNRSVHNRNQIRDGRTFPSLQLSVRRDQVFHDSFKSLYFKSGDEMKFGKLNIRFHGEEGVDAGGVTREWFQVLSRQMFDPNYALFVPVSSDRTTFHPNKLSGINDEHLMFFKFIGRVIGKALYEGRVLDCYFSRAVYKRILGKQVSVKDMESFDPDYYKSLVWMLENDITDIITETFSVETDEFGVTKIEDLCENGRNIPVTEENKQDYVRLVVEHKLLSSVKEQMEHFLKGFHEIIPAELVSIFNEQELELLISGLPDIDVDDWKSNTEYQNYTPSSQQIQWFWRALRSFDKEELAKLLQFVTGTSKVPLNGFKELEGMNGINRFNIHRDYGNKDRLPSSHTCFNQLDLPEYESYDILRAQLLKAITAGSDYFGFA